MDTSDFNSNYVVENLTINDQESIIELVVEKILGYENAIPEIDDCDSENHILIKKSIALDFFTIPSFPFDINQFENKSNSKNTSFSNSAPLKTYLEIHSPPPEA
ncbi:hypothetical protein GON26_09355 [Flavobacterium sp. GA093]|uniref:Uncharacterized protein n=1 Tax=Flavobacterium hydrocarbonoxydans TaxID=2683249 RepID=A0A6I4NSC6_9FLAO|nr:hypothetical protein [Flavobacterium hydrocarbonoxydans]MWB94569.1 hypothetical protein [Flavobacterium hydrocarbonoxydans]